MKYAATFGLLISGTIGNLNTLNTSVGGDGVKSNTLNTSVGVGGFESAVIELMCPINPPSNKSPIN
jgi:hypothetical protein